MDVQLDPNIWRPTVRKRLGVLAILLAAWAAAIEARLVYMQVYDHDEWMAKAARQQVRLIPMPARRGDILDRHGRVLAYSVDGYSVYAAPAQMKSVPDVIAKLCAALDGCSAQERRSFEQRFAKKDDFEWVRRRVTNEQARRVANLKLPCLGLMNEPRRYYPNRELAAHLLGYVGTDEQGLAGLEEMYDGALRGRPSRLLIQQAAGGHVFSRVGEPPVPGSSLELTIDLDLQYIAERELKAGVEANRAKGGSVVIISPQTGEILAMANAPGFNPNDYNLFDADARKNRAVQDTYEPGSTFKMITATAGLEEKKVTPETLIATGNGVLQMGYRVVRDTHGHGTIPFSEVIALSSNIGAIKVGWMLGPELLGKFVRLFGFGTRLSKDFRGESAGLVWDPSQWEHDGALASVAMGYQIGVTPLQMATAASAIANGGELMRPRAVRAVIDGNTYRPVPHEVLRRVMSPRTAAALVSMLEGVTEHGTAKTVQIEGFTIAGKTGTSAKLEGRHYSKSEYNASFVGFVPSRQPALTILVWIDTPRAGSTYGGVVAGPIFQRIAAAALRHLAVPPTVNPAPPVLVHRDAGKEMMVAGPTLPLTVMPPVPTVAGELVLPELRGLGGRDALRLLGRLGLSARVSGDGVVLEQEPPAGTPMEPGASCRLALGRSMPRDGNAGGVHP